MELYSEQTDKHTDKQVGFYKVDFMTVGANVHLSISPTQPSYKTPKEITCDPHRCTPSCAGTWLKGGGLSKKSC